VIYTIMDSPIGKLLLGKEADGLAMIQFEHQWTIDPAWCSEAERFAAEMAQLRGYFEGSRRVFDVPLALTGTPFQLKVWAALNDIPYGETVTYGELARRVGQPDAVRAVGAANGKNPVPIIVPCHRVIGSNGELTGYGGGLPIKAALLDLERRYRHGEQLRLF
jgi:methylated-DNA-[protein]-cysteine S-methyltransferase